MLYHFVPRYNSTVMHKALHMMVHSVCFTRIVIVDVRIPFHVLSQFVPSLTKLKKKLGI